MIYRCLGVIQARYLELTVSLVDIDPLITQDLPNFGDVVLGDGTM